MKLLENLNWRYATKRFSPTKKVTQRDLEKLKEAIRLSVSSYGLQLYKVLIIIDQDLKERLRPVSWDQRQITECSHLFVFCNYTDVRAEHIDDYITLQAAIQETPSGDLKRYADFIKAKLSEKSPEQKTNWLQRQPYLALSNLLMACAELKIDACPMEGFEPDQYNEILGLHEKGLHAVVIATIGYRSDEDLCQSAKKVRKPVSLLFEQR
jgi:nitroreductase/dihydropteridine reductase